MSLTHISLKSSLSYTILCIACIWLISGCSLPWRHHTISASSANIPKPTAQQLLAAVQKNFKTVSSFHVVLQVQKSRPGLSR